MSISDEDLKRWRELGQVATTRPWAVWSSNSHQRIGSSNFDGNVIGTMIARDGMPVLTGSNLTADLTYVIAAVNATDKLVPEVERLRAELAACLKERDEARTELRDPHTAPISSAAELNWEAVERAAEIIIDVTKSFWTLPPEATRQAKRYMLRVCAQLDVIVEALKLSSSGRDEVKRLRAENAELRAELRHDEEQMNLARAAKVLAENETED